LQQGPKQYAKMSLLTKIDLTIDQDWSQVMSIHDSIEAKWKNNQLANTLKTSAKSDVYTVDIEIVNLGPLGFLSPIQHLVKPGHYSSLLFGKIFESKLPWIKQLRQDVAELNLHEVILFKTNGNIATHVDANFTPGFAKQTTKINIVLKNSDAIVYVTDGVVTETHDAQAGDAWLLDVANSHWVDTTELYMLQLWFYSDYRTVLEWFNSRPGLTYK